jgi:signal transduction histidine kinase
MIGLKSSSASDLQLKTGRPPHAAASPRFPFAYQRLTRRIASVREFFHPLVELLRIPPPTTEKVLQRIEMMERHIVLPIRVAGIAILLQYFKPWITQSSLTLDVSYEDTRYFVCAYAGLNLLFAPVLIWMRRLPPGVVERSVFAMSLVDGIFLGVLTLITGGYNSSVYWLFLALMVRSAVSVPRAVSQLLLNLTLSTCYIMAGVIDTLIASKLDDVSRRFLELSAAENPGEPLLLRLALLLLMTFGCYAVQVLLERQRRAEEEARELAVREVQLQSAGRLAGEFAHQVKNPLAIINNAVFSLRRTRRGQNAESAEQLQMIQEEIERVDRIITQVMGYAQLCEGHVEKLDVLEELDQAIDRVFPPAARYPIKVHRQYIGSFPPLLMQRRHAAEAFVNVLQNARDALESKGGNILVSAQCLEDRVIEVSIHDDGPGIPADKQGRIFEAYYTTKQKGTGLGLATVKHSLELYGGSVRVESELGKGARFILSFPAKSLMRLAKMN